MPISLRFGDDIERRLGNLAKKTGRTKSFYVRLMVQQSLDDVEDIYLAAAEAEKVRSGRTRTFSLDEMRDECGLEHQVLGRGKKRFKEAAKGGPAENHR